MSRDWLWPSIAVHIDKLLRYFGRERVFVLRYPGAFEAASGEWSALSAFLDCGPGNVATANRGNARGGIPYYVYAHERGTYCLGERAMDPPAGTLVLVNGEDSHVWFGVDESTGRDVLSRAESWTPRPSAAEVNRLYDDEFKADFEAVLSALGVAQHGVEAGGPIETAPATPGEAIVEAVNARGAVDSGDIRRSPFLGHLT